MYRKAALKIVQDIGEPELSESAAKIIPPSIAAVDASTPSSTIDPASTIIQHLIEKQDGEVEAGADRKASTGIRAPLVVPSTVHVSITAENLLEYVGPPMYQKDRMYTNTSPVGVSCGLGYLGNGSGAVMPIEVTVRSSSFFPRRFFVLNHLSLQSMPGTGGILLTGKLGEVIKESAQIALSFLKSNAFNLGLTQNVDDDLLSKKSIHLHMP